MVEWHVVPVGEILIVEGRYAYVKALTTFYDLRMWVECPLEAGRRRLGQ